jgi:hypothetical protein
MSAVINPDWMKLPLDEVEYEAAQGFKPALDALRLRGEAGDTSAALAYQQIVSPS